MNKCPHEHQIETLCKQIEQLSRRLSALETAAPRPFCKEPQVEAKPAQPTPPDPELLLASGSSALQQAATLSFLLVAALGLRALTDNDLLDQQLGTGIGLSYAFALILLSHRLYRKENALAPLLNITGSLLCYAVLVETYTRYSSLPLPAVYALLATTGICLAMISYANRVALPIIVGTLGMCLAGVAIDYPTPYFPLLGLLLWLANILGFFASRLRRSSWLRWFLLFTTHFMLQIWGLKLSGKFMRQPTNPELLAPDWFIPIVILIGLSFMLTSLFGIIRSGDERISRFDFSLPAINAAWCYVAGIYALKDPVAFGTPAAMASVIHFTLAYWLSTRQRRNAPGTNTFVTGGVILACLSLPALLGSLLAPMPLLAGLALTICYLSRQWLSGGMRVTATLLQIYIGLLVGLELFNSGVAANPIPTILTTGLCSLLALLHYRFCRRYKPSPQSQFFNRIDKQDISTIFVLLACLANGYYALIEVSHLLLSSYLPASQQSAFTASQSLVINAAAILLMTLSFRHRNKELRNTSSLLILAGGAKVFFVDMLQLSGIWLVCSLFSFGLAAALASIVLARWQPTSAAAPTRTK